MSQRLLTRIFILTVSLMLLSLLAFSAAVNHFSLAPRAQQKAQLIISMVNLSRSAILSAADDWRGVLLEDFASQEGLRIQLADIHDQLEPITSPPIELQKIMSIVRQRLGQDTLFANKRNGVEALWVSFNIGKQQFWLALPKERLDDQRSTLMFIWIAVIVLLALLGAYWIARQISLPLKQLAQAAASLGNGQIPDVLTPVNIKEINIVRGAFNQMTQALHQHEKERALVLAGISHDLRTPLTRVRLAAEMIDNDSMRQGLICDVAQMDDIIQQFLDYSRLEQIEENHLVLIQDFVSKLLQQHPNTDQWHFECESDIQLTIKPKLLKRALYNLIDNAQKYGKAPYTLTINRQAQYCCINIIDQGEGIPKQQYEQVLRPFIRLDQARSNVQGSGLGLAIVARIIKQHNGQLTMQQPQTGGFMVQIQLPINT